MKTLFLFTTIMIISNNVFAETKQLICANQISSDLIEKIIKSPISVCTTVESRKKRNRPPLDVLVEECEKLKKNLNLCKNAPFEWRHTFTFDTNDLKSSGTKTAEAFSESCNTKAKTIGVVSSERMLVSASIISFAKIKESFLALEKERKSSFNIDRKTLKAGWKTERDYKCEVKDVDTSDNKI